MLEVGLADSTDAEIWEYATRNDCVVISKDEDFLYLANSADAKARFHLDSIRELPHEGALGCNGECVAEGGGRTKSGKPHYRTPIAVGLAA